MQTNNKTSITENNMKPDTMRKFYEPHPVDWNLLMHKTGRSGDWRRQGGEQPYTTTNTVAAAATTTTTFLPTSK
jgi:hypothetical protein